MSWISVNQTSFDCPYKSVQLICPWSVHLLLISPIGNHNSFVFKQLIILMLLSSDAFVFFLLMVEYRYSHLTLYRPPDLFVDYYLPSPCVRNQLRASPDTKYLRRTVSYALCHQPSAFK